MNRENKNEVCDFHWNVCTLCALFMGKHWRSVCEMRFVRVWSWSQNKCALTLILDKFSIENTLRTQKPRPKWHKYDYRKSQCNAMQCNGLSNCLQKMAKIAKIPCGIKLFDPNFVILMFCIFFVCVQCKENQTVFSLSPGWSFTEVKILAAHKHTHTYTPFQCDYIQLQR